MNKAKKKTAPGPAAEPEDGEQLEPDPDEEGLPWEAELEEWQAGERVDESTLQVVLYRLRGPGKGKERVWKWSDEIPDEHEIGLTFGGGTYMVYAVLSAPGGFRKVKHRRFTLAASYDVERARAQREQGLNQAGPAGVNLAGSSSFEMMLAMMERVIVPLLAARGAPAAAGGDLSHWNQANEIVGRVVEASANSQLKIAREAGAMLAQNGAGRVAGDDEEAEDGDFKDYLKGVIKEYGPTLIEAAGLKLKAMAGIVKRDEVFTQLASNPDLFGRVVKLLTKDPEVDAGQVEKVLTKLQGLGVAIPLPPGFVFKPRPVSGPVNGSPVPS